MYDTRNGAASINLSEHRGLAPKLSKPSVVADGLLLMSHRLSSDGRSKTICRVLRSGVLCRDAVRRGALPRVWRFLKPTRPTGRTKTPPPMKQGLLRVVLVEAPSWFGVIRGPDRREPKKKTPGKIKAPPNESSTGLVSYQVELPWVLPCVV